MCLSSPTCRGSPAFLPSWPGCHGSSLCVGIYCLRPGDPVPSIPGRPPADGLAAEREGLLALCLPVASRGHHASGSMYPSLRLPLVRYCELVLLSGPRPMACPGPCHAGLSPAAARGREGGDYLVAAIKAARVVASSLNADGCALLNSFLKGS